MTTKNLTNDELGRISWLMGKRNIPAEYQAGYDAAQTEAAAHTERLAARMAEYNRLHEQGLTDAEIQRVLS